MLFVVALVLLLALCSFSALMQRHEVGQAVSLLKDGLAAQASCICVRCFRFALLRLHQAFMPF
jgi:hypothetical protein